MQFSGNVIIRLPNVILTAEKATFNRKTGRNTLYDTTMYDSKNGAFVEAVRIEQVSEDEFIIHKGVLTRCKEDKDAWKMKGHYIVYKVDNFAYSVSTSLHFYGVPIFYTPILSFPTKQGRSTGLLVPTYSFLYSADESRRYGGRLQLPYFIALDRDHDVTITADFIQLRGLGTDIDYLYAFTPDMSGQFRTWFLKETARNRKLDYENLGTLVQDKDSLDTNPLRYKYSYDHRQNIPLNGQLFFHQNENSDNEINKEYFDAEVDSENHFTQTFSLVFPWNTGSLSTSYETADDFIYTSIYDKSNDRETHLNKQPTVSVSQRFSRIIDTPLSVNLTGTGTRYVREYGWNGQIRQGSVQLTSPFYVDFLNIWPSVRRTWTHLDANYSAKPGVASEDKQSFGWQIDYYDLELNFEIYRLFYNYENVATEKFSIRPRIIYSEVQDVDQSDEDQTGFLGAPYSWKTLTYKLESRYQVKDPDTENVRTLLGLDLTQIYNLQMEGDQTWLNQAPNLETEPGDPRLPLRINLTFSPFSLFSANLFYRFDHNENRIVETSIGLSTSTSGGDSFSLSYAKNESSYYEPNASNHPASSIYAINHTLKLTDRLTLNMAGDWDQSRSSLSNRYDDTTGVKRLDRQLTNMSTQLIYNHGCYLFIAAYNESIQSKLINDITTEYLEQRLTLTFQFNILPSSVGGGSIPRTGAQFQQGFLLSR